MKAGRTEILLDRALDYISTLIEGEELYDCFHVYLGMTNAEIEETGYELMKFYQEDSLEQKAAAGDNRYQYLELLESQARTAVEYIISQGRKRTDNEACLIPFGEIEKEIILPGKDSLFFRKLVGQMLGERKEITYQQLSEEGYEVELAPEYSAQCSRENDKQETLCGQEQAEKSQISM